MKVLVVSDVHANIAALNTILEKEADYRLSVLCRGLYRLWNLSGGSDRTVPQSEKHASCVWQP